MNELVDHNALTNSNFWDSYWDAIPIPNTVVPADNHVLRSMDRIFRQYLPFNPKFKFLEIGCAPGRWLVYFARQFGYQVAGSEESPRGLELTKKNLELCKIKNFKLWNPKSDRDLIRAERFNVVASFGLIEHFKNPYPMLQQHIKVLADRGYLIIEMPHMRGLNYLIQTVADPEFLDRHNTEIMTREYLRQIAKDFGLKVIFLDFIGGFTPSDYHFSRPKFLHLDYVFNLFIRALSKVRQPLTFLDSVNSSIFSGYLMAIYQKQGTGGQYEKSLPQQP